MEELCLQSQVQDLAQWAFLLQAHYARAMTTVDSQPSLNLPQLRLLLFIGAWDSCTMSQLAKASGLSLSSVTLIVDHLVRSTYVFRARSKQDRRRVFVQLTKRGHQLYQQQQRMIDEKSNECMQQLEPQERAEFMSYVSRCLAHWRQQYG